MGDVTDAVAVRLLGPIEIAGPYGTAVLSGTRQRALVALLALHAGAPVPRSRLVDALWGEAPPRTAVRTLHSHVARVRQALDGCGLPGVLVTQGPGYALRLPPDRVDVHRFTSAVRRSRDLDSAAAAATLDDALALWRGEPLVDAGAGDWVDAETQRLGEARLEAYQRLWQVRLELGGHAAAVPELEQLVHETPVREPLVALLMTALYRTGRHTDALERYQRLRTRLGEELGVDPGPELQRLHTAILRRDPALDPPAAAPAVPVREAAPAQLPPAVGHFTGREAALAALHDADPETRVLVVSGTGGIGKTALAVHWAHQVRHRFPDGQLFLDLRGHDPDTALTPGEALRHMLRGLGVPGERVPAGVAEQTALLRTTLQDAAVLLVLDNAGTADHVLPLVPPAPPSTLLVTSRSQLAGLAVRHAVHPVALEELEPDEARALLRRVLGADRLAREPDAVELLIGLCGRMPLALRIVAAKLAARPRQRIADLAVELAGDRLDGFAVPGDPRDLRSVFGSAYAALSEPAARLFRLLALHPGTSFTSHLAAALAGASYGRARRWVDELAAAHLVAEIDSGRYQLHDLIRLYAAERADAEEPAGAREQARNRILDWYVAVADAANQALDPTRDRIAPAQRGQLEPAPFPAEAAAALGFLDGERPNLLPVVSYAADHVPRAAYELTYLLAGYFDRRGSWDDQTAVCRLGVAAAARAGEPGIEGVMHSALGVVCIAARRYPEAIDALTEALRLVRAAGNLRDEGHVHNNLAVAYVGQGRFDAAADAFDRALDCHRDGDPAALAVALNNVGYASVLAGDPVRGEPYLTRALALARDVGDQPLRAAILHGLGIGYRDRGDYPKALEALRDSLAAYRRLGDTREVPGGLADIGVTLMLAGEPAAAYEQLTEALALARELGDPHGEATILEHLERCRLLTAS